MRGFSTGRTLRTGRLKETNNLVGKFVLPTRSVHSSRVIKPNKRFINVELSDTRTFKKKVITKVKLHDEKAKPSRNKSDNVSDNEKTTCHTSHHNVPSGFPQTPNGRVVIRQARLQLHTQAPSGPEGPFSNTSNNNPPGTVTCGVCGAVRFYRFVKQARKFNIYSCESCRKFISKMIKRQTCGKNLAASTLVCHKGQGMCHVPPIVRSQQWKLIRCAYRARCPACWLKMCLRSFQMPMALKNSLAQLLPKNMQGPELLFNSSLPLLSWQANVESKEKTVKECDNQRPTRLKATVVNVEKAVAPVNNEIKRQKIDLKGPRVKHVCRSASIVLGQPLATFSNEPDAKKQPVESPKAETKDTNVEVKVTEVTPHNSDSFTESDTPSETEQTITKESMFKQPQAKNDASTRREKPAKNTSISYSCEVNLLT